MSDRLPAVFTADAAVGADLDAVDWSVTPLGLVTDWPQSLQTAVAILLSSRFPMWMAWGPELTFFCNAAYRRDTLGRKYPWALGRPAHEVWAEIWGDIGPRIERVLSTGEATWDEALLLFLERSGYSEESYHTFSYSPLRDESSAVVGMLCVVSEDTERVIGERRMATLRDLGSDLSVVRTERQMLDFVAHQLDGNLRDLPFTLTYLCGEDGDVHLAGASGVPDDHPAAPRVLSTEEDALWPAATVMRGNSIVVDLEAPAFVNLPTGAWQEPPAYALVVPLLQQGDSPSGFIVAGLNRHRPVDEGYRGFVELVASHIAAGVGSARSFSAQQQRAEELAELDRAKTTFFSNVSHEFRTPLTLILGPVNELRNRATGIDESARHELDLVYRNASRLAKLVNTLLDFSRIQAGRMQARFEPVDLAAVTSELASVFRSAIDRAGIAFAVDCHPLHEAVYVDRDMWEKVVLNLLSNALKYTLDGSITVSVHRAGAGAVVTVADTGIGIPDDEIPRLFERFHRIESPRARSTEGSGIGLALVRELVTLHGGSIAARSRFGEGSEFTVRLPFGAAHLPADDVAPAESTRTIPANADPYVQEALRWLPGDARDDAVHDDVALTPADGAGAPMRVVVADDNADMRDYLTHLLRGSGYDVIAVNDGREALDTIRGQAPDLVISDVMMPRVDGLQLLAALRSESRTAALPVLLLSARAGQEASIEGLQAGADDYLVKPFAAAELLARVRANVQMARLRNHHSRWRTALVDSLQEAFFVCDETGAVVEINTAFTDILGFGPEGLPYEPPQPWWPDAESDPEGHRQCAEAFEGILHEIHGSYTVPVRHRDGHRRWITVSFNRADDPETGRRVMVGTFRDVTAEHYAVQRTTALAELNQALAQSDSLDAAIGAAAEDLRSVWRADSVLAFTFPTTSPESPEVVSADERVRWTDLTDEHRARVLALRDGELLAADVTCAGSAGIALQQPRGVLVVWIQLSEERPFSGGDQTLLAALAARLGQGLHRVHQLDQQRETALALQHAILGPALLPGGFAVRYLPASSPLQVGGDWYDVVNLDDGRIALIVGDCVGHGLAAATVMGQLRSACRALLIEQLSPAAALMALDRFAARLPGAECTTALCAVLDPATGELVYSSAGHPPAVLVRADRGVELLEGGRGLPLALRLGRIRPEARVTVPPRATLLLYTDGLVERRDAPIDDGINRVARLLGEGSTVGLGDAAERVVAGSAPEDGYQDDVALLAYRQPAPLSLEFSATLDAVAPTRGELRAWLARSGVDPETLTDVLIAAGEAVANSIEHGHRDNPGGAITLHADSYGDHLRVTVADSGSWKPRRAHVDSSRGRGIDLMRGLVHDVDIQSGESGTTVRLSARII